MAGGSFAVGTKHLLDLEPPPDWEIRGSAPVLDYISKRRLPGPEKDAP